jgi:hypothetical protein
MTKTQLLLLLLFSGTLFRAVEPEFRSPAPEPSAQIIQKAENGFVSVTEMFEAPPDKKDKTHKTVFVTASIENVELNAVDFTGFFSLHTAKIGDKQKRYSPAQAYTLGSTSFNLVTEPIVDLFKDRPFGPGEKRSVVMAFSVPVSMKPTKIFIPTQNGGVELDLSE